MVVRGCGSRVSGGVYLEVGTSKYGQPIENFLFCPPKRLDKDALGATNLGVTLIQDKTDPTLCHVLDIVGASSYPNCADIIEEIRRFGASRKVNPKLPFAQLKPGSKILLAHDKAILKNHEELRERIRLEHIEYVTAQPVFCPKDIAAHDECGRRSSNWGYEVDPTKHGSGMCLELLYNVIEGGTPANDPDRPVREVTRKCGDTQYIAQRAPLGFVPDWECGVFAAFYITRIAVVDDPDDPEGAAMKLALVEESSLITELVNE
jgi:hypothetical protein